MTNHQKQAITKLEEGLDTGSYDKYAKAMKKEVSAALIEFCRQSEEFSRAVLDGGSFSECMAAVAKGCGSSISDLEAYKKAAGFYFPGSDISFEMHILMSEYEREEEPAKADTGKRAVLIDLSEFL